MIQDDVWPVDGALAAECRVDASHVAPVEGCTCGVYAAREPAAVWSYLRGRDEPRTLRRVLGRVALSGRVVEHECGWRAERATPLDLVAGVRLAQLATR